MMEESIMDTSISSTHPTKTCPVAGGDGQVTLALPARGGMADFECFQGGSRSTGVEEGGCPVFSPSVFAPSRPHQPLERMRKLDMRFFGLEMENARAGKIWVLVQKGSVGV